MAAKGHPLTENQEYDAYDTGHENAEELSVYKACPRTEVIPPWGLYKLQAASFYLRSVFSRCVIASYHHNRVQLIIQNGIGKHEGSQLCWAVQGQGGRC